MYAWTGRIGRRPGNLLVHGSSGVRQVGPCADGHVTWSMIDNPAMMRAVVAKLEEHDDAGPLSDIDWPKVLVADTDQEVIDSWQEIFGPFFARHTKADLGAWSLAQAWGLSPIASLEEVRDSDHLAARNLFVEVAKGDGETVRLPGPLFATHRPEQTP